MPKLYAVEIYEKGGLYGPHPDRRHVAEYIPDDEYRGESIFLVEFESHEDKALILQKWDWDINKWVDPDPVKTTIKLRTGCMAPPLKEQLAGYGFSDESIEIWQKDLDAMSHLYVRGYMNQSTIERAEKKLLAKIKKEPRMFVVDEGKTDV